MTTETARLFGAVAGAMEARTDQEMAAFLEQAERERFTFADLVLWGEWADLTGRANDQTMRWCMAAARKAAARLEIGSVDAGALAGMSLERVAWSERASCACGTARTGDADRRSSCAPPTWPPRPEPVDEGLRLQAGVSAGRARRAGSCCSRLQMGRGQAGPRRRRRGRTAGG